LHNFTTVNAIALRRRATLQAANPVTGLTMTNDTAQRPPHPEKSPINGADRAPAEGAVEFGRFRMLPRQRVLLADGAPIELGTRAFELLVALLEADGSVVSKEQLLARVWPGIVVAGIT
jgi:DNA-binding response OmpR family regulator